MCHFAGNWKGKRIFVTASEFHGVPFGLVPAGLFRYGVGPVMVWLFRFCKRPNGMEAGFSLLSLWLVVAEEAGLHRRIRCVTQYRKSHNHSVWPKEPRINTPGHAGNGQGKQCLARAGRPNGIRDSQGQANNEKASFMMIRGCFLGVCSFQKPSCRLFVHRPLQISEILVHLKINS